MKLSITVVITLVLPLLPIGLSAPMPDRPRKAATEFDWAKKGPVEFIAYLIRQEDRGVKNVSVSDAPKGWIARRHLDVLIALMDSDEPCASVGSHRSSRLPTSADWTVSTIGHEAAYLIESYRHGLYPKYAVNCSAKVKLDKAELKLWWSREKKRLDSAR
jgi:hypothetical protein